MVKQTFITQQVTIIIEPDLPSNSIEVYVEGGALRERQYYYNVFFGNKRGQKKLFKDMTGLNFDDCF